MLGRLVGGLDHDEFVFDGGQAAECGLASSAVVGAFDPGDDRDPELVAGVPGVSVEDVLLEQGEKGFHCGVVAGGADLAHRAEHAVTGERLLQFECPLGHHLLEVVVLRLHLLVELAEFLGDLGAGTARDLLANPVAVLVISERDGASPPVAVSVRYKLPPEVDPLTALVRVLLAPAPPLALPRP